MSWLMALLLTTPKPDYITIQTTRRCRLETGFVVIEEMDHNNILYHYKFIKDQIQFDVARICSCLNRRQ